MLMDKIPSFMVNWVMEEEEKMAKNRPTVKFVGSAEMSIHDVVRSVQGLIQVAPKEVTSIASGGFLLRFDNVSLVQKLVELNGRKISGTYKKIQVKETNLHLPMESIFRFVESKLQLREKSEAFQSSKEFGNALPSRQNRNAKKDKNIGKVETSNPPVLVPMHHGIHGGSMAGGGGPAPVAPTNLPSGSHQLNTNINMPPTGPIGGPEWGGKGYVPPWWEEGGGGGGKGCGFAQYPS